MALAPPFTAQGEVGGRIQQEAAYRFGDQASWTKGLSFLQLEMVEWADNRRLTAIGRVFYDGVLDRGDPFRLNPNLAAGDPQSPKVAGVEAKEVYIDFLGERVDLRLGRQIVRWGVLEGARITDRVNPLDFREFLFRDVEDRYIPLWMARADIYPQWGRVQLLAIPEMTFHKPAPAGSEWEEFELPPDTARPATSLKNTEWGILAGWTVGGTDLTASYLYTWDDFPAAFRSVFGVGGQLTGADFAPRYQRLHVLGATASRSLGGQVVSLELSYDHGKRLATDVDAGIAGNEIARDIVRWGSGIDTNLLGVDVSALYFQEYVVGWKSFIPVNRLEQGASLMIRETRYNNRLELRLLALYFFTGHQSIIRPQVDFKLTDHVKVGIGADLLSGQRGSAPNQADAARDFRFVGFFKDHDRVTATVSYRF